MFYQRLGDLDTAIKYGEKAVSLCYEFDCGRSLGYAYVQLATFHGHILQFEESFEFFQIGIKYCLKYEDYKQLVGAYVLTVVASTLPKPQKQHTLRSLHILSKKD